MDALEQLAATIERPAWLRDQLLAKRSEIASVLHGGGSVALCGPHGERVYLSVKLNMTARTTLGEDAAAGG
jgi:hypothetical protein